MHNKGETYDGIFIPFYSVILFSCFHARVVRDGMCLYPFS